MAKNLKKLPKKFWGRLDVSDKNHRLGLLSHSKTQELLRTYTYFTIRPKKLAKDEDDKLKELLLNLRFLP
jgi:hypothetical protein